MHSPLSRHIHAHTGKHRASISSGCTTHSVSGSNTLIQEQNDIGQVHVDNKHTKGTIHRHSLRLIRCQHSSCPLVVASSLKKKISKSRKSTWQFLSLTMVSFPAYNTCVYGSSVRHSALGIGPPCPAPVCAPPSAPPSAAPQPHALSSANRNNYHPTTSIRRQKLLKLVSVRTTV